MSKLLNQYNNLKKKANNKIYLFKVGIFYIAINEDAKYLNEQIGLKITDLGVSMYKVGFPINNKAKYENLFKSKNIIFEFVDNIPNETNSNEKLNNSEIKKIINKILELDLDNINMIQSFNFLCDVQSKFRAIFKEQ